MEVREGDPEGHWLQPGSEAPPRGQNNPSVDSQATSGLEAAKPRRGGVGGPLEATGEAELRSTVLSQNGAGPHGAQNHPEVHHPLSLEI